jgi:DNA invertase Pin-like site-specific DNA recombinase
MSEVRVWGYGRHSTEKQGLTEEAQRTKVESYIQLHLPDVAYGGWLYDTAVSRGTPMFERPKGRELWALVQPGDHVVVAKLDRAFGKTVDGLRSLEMLAAKGVSFQSADRQIDTSTAIGRACLTVVMAFAQLDREQTAERTRDALAVKRAAGQPYGRFIPYGWRKVGVKKDSRFLPCQKERDQCYMIKGFRDAGMSWDDVVECMRSKIRPRGMQWNRNTVKAAYQAVTANFPKSPPAARRPGAAGA